MSLRDPVRWLFLSAVGCMPLAAPDAISSETARPSTAQTVTTLRTSHKVSMSRPESIWVSQRADDDGNLYFLVMPEVDPRDASKGPPPPNAGQPRDIHFLSADGKTTRVLSPAAIPQFAGENLVTPAIATDPDGRLFALVWATRGDEGRYYVVTFDKGGGYRSRQQIEPEEISVGRFEVFGSGEFLLLGRKAHSDTPRVAVMSSGGTLTDVKPSSSEEPKNGKLGPAFPGQHVARGGDGRIYFVPEGSDTVHFVEASGNSQTAFKLVPMPRNRRLLVDLKMSGQRLAAIYFEERPQDGGQLWIAVYDVLVGERLAVYGPVSGIPVRYQHSDGQDRFTLVRDAKDLVTVVSP